jgi:serine/threonine-protein kinase TNNI3K
MLCFLHVARRDAIAKVANLMEELGRQRDLKETYKARLESTQGYLRFCLEVAQEHGFLHLISDDSAQQQQQRSPHRDAEAEPGKTADDDDDVDEPVDPYLVATHDLAVRHGWSVTPDEVKINQELTFCLPVA